MTYFWSNLCQVLCLIFLYLSKNSTNVICIVPLYIDWIWISISSNNCLIRFDLAVGIQYLNKYQQLVRINVDRKLLYISWIASSGRHSSSQLCVVSCKCRLIASGLSTNLKLMLFRYWHWLFRYGILSPDSN